MSASLSAHRRRVVQDALESSEVGRLILMERRALRQANERAHWQDRESERQIRALNDTTFELLTDG